MPTKAGHKVSFFMKGINSAKNPFPRAEILKIQDS
jgi:hypothetical protein